ncbi:hypothetical protein, partial [Pseudonocardia sp. KRD291]|uniref:hypothetical protein n=1 Tax=Pseudonocardia sp. KRD291 TaxID=2792007 RepID=UPI001C49DCD4
MPEPQAGGSQGFDWNDVPVVGWFVPDPEPPEGVALEDLPGVDWSGWSLRDKIAWTSQGSGAQAIDSAHGALGDLGGRFRESDGTVRRGLDGMQVGWQGRAAGSATEALDRVAAAGGAGGDTSAGGTVPVGTYGHSFDGLKNKFSYHDSPLTSALGDWAPTVRGLTLTTPVLAGFGVGDEMVKIGMNASEGKRADDLLQSHESAARVAVTAFPSGTPSPGLPGIAGP